MFKVRWGEHGLSTLTTGIRSPRMLSRRRTHALLKTIADSLAEGTGHSRSCGHCAVFSLPVDTVECGRTCWDSGLQGALLSAFKDHRLHSALIVCVCKRHFTLDKVINCLPVTLVSEGRWQDSCLNFAMS